MLTRHGFGRLCAGAVGCACLLVALSLTGCGSGADEVAVRSAVEGRLGQLLSSPTADDVTTLVGQATATELSEYGIDRSDFVARCLARASFEVTDVSVDGDTATVTLDLTNADLSSAMQTAADRFSSYLDTDEAQASYDEGGEAALMATLFQYYYEAIDAAADTTQTVTLACMRGEDGSWTCDVAGSPALVAALVGNAPSGDAVSSGGTGATDASGSAAGGSASAGADASSSVAAAGDASGSAAAA